MTTFERIIKLIKEPSTFAGLAAALGGVGMLGMGESEWTQIFGGVAVIAGLIAMFTLDTGDAE